MKKSKISIDIDFEKLNEVEKREMLKMKNDKIEFNKWKILKGIEQAVKRNQDYFNNLIVHSFGVDNGSQPKGSRAFDCRRLNLRGSGLDLKFGRGCDDEFQKIASADPEFIEFIHLVAKCVLENSLTNISFYCSKGHHRSVAAATLFCNTFAPKAKLFHTCLKK